MVCMVEMDSFDIGCFSKNKQTSLSSGNFGTLSGFYGSLKNTGIISGEFNEQIGPHTKHYTLDQSAKEWT